jgi:hypothetical protein
MPTTEYEDEAVEEVYEEIEELIKHVKGDENLILGDWNAIVEGKDRRITSNYGLGKQNERGERVVEFCDKHKLVVANTLFQNHERRRYTWMMPGDRGRHQIDYVLVKQRFRNQVKNCKTYPGADIDSDHNMMLMKCNLKFKRMVKRKPQGQNVRKLRETKVRVAYEQKTDEMISDKQEECIDSAWNHIKTTIVDAAEKVVGNKGRKSRSKKRGSSTRNQRRRKVENDIKLSEMR